VFFAVRLHQQFFPRDNFYISYVDIHLPEDVPISETDRATREAERVIQEVAANIDGQNKGTSNGYPLLASITSFIGGVTRKCCVFSDTRSSSAELFSDPSAVHPQRGH